MKYILLILRPSSESPGNLEGCLQKLNQAPYEGVSTIKHRCAKTIQQEGKDLIGKYGIKPTDELQRNLELFFQR